MRQINKTKKTGILRKLFVKISRILGFELIDQADLSFVSSNKQNPSKLGKKSITLPLGEVKIKRKINSLDVVLKTCTSVNLVSQNKKRIFEYDKPEYTFRSLNSIIKSLKKASNLAQNIKFRISIIDSGSSDSDLEKMKTILKKSDLKFEIIILDINKYLKRIKVINRGNSQIENNMKSTMASIIKSFELTKTNFDDLIYFVEDDYIHTEESIIEMIFSYEKFATIFENEIFIVPVDYPYLYQKNNSTELLIGQNYHWRSIKESLLTFLTSKKMVHKYYNDLIKMGEVEHKPYEKILHDIYDKEKCFSPVPSLAIHCTNVNSVFGLSPNVDIKKLWDQNKN